MDTIACRGGGGGTRASLALRAKNL